MAAHVRQQAGAVGLSTWRVVGQSAKYAAFLVVPPAVMDQTKVMDDALVQVMSWYDNELGFSTAAAMGKLIGPACNEH